MADIYHKLTIAAPASEVYSCLTDVEKISSWCEMASGSGLREGDTLHFGDDNFYHEAEVKNLSENKKVVWEIVKMHSPQTEWKVWEGTKNEFILEEKQLERLGGKTATVVLFKHSGWTDEMLDSKMFAECNWFWAYLLLSLKYVAEGKEGLPMMA